MGNVEYKLKLVDPTQERLEQLHAAKLLADDEQFAVEDLCADYMELQASVPNGGSLTQDMIYTAVGHSHTAAAKLHKLVRLSDGMASDAASTPYKWPRRYASQPAILTSAGSEKKPGSHATGAHAAPSCAPSAAASRVAGARGLSRT